MATALIPEVIQPGVLYAPSANNFFSIAAASLPNTDDALSCAGGSGNFRAYQPAISDIHYPATPGQDHSICFWINSGASGGGSSGSSFIPAQTFMCVTDPTLTASVQASTASTTGFRWGMSQGTTSTGNIRYFNFHVATNALVRVTIGYTVAVSTWQGVCMRHSTSVLGASTWNLTNMNLSGSNGTAASVGTPGAVTSPNFSIGPYALGVGWTAVQATLLLAKIAIFPTYYLTDQDLLDLYDSMINGPPSP